MQGPALLVFKGRRTPSDVCFQALAEMFEASDLQEKQLLQTPPRICGPKMFQWNQKGKQTVDEDQNIFNQMLIQHL